MHIDKMTTYRHAQPGPCRLRAETLIRPSELSRAASLRVEPNDVTPDAEVAIVAPGVEWPGEVWLVGEVAGPPGQRRVELQRVEDGAGHVVVDFGE